MSSLKKLASDTALYGVSSIVGRMLNFLLVPLYTEVFAAGAYGVVTELYAYVAFFNVLYTYGLETAYFRFASREKLQEKKVFNTAFTSILGSSLFLSGLIILLAPQILSWIDYENLPTEYLYWLALIIGIDAIVAIPFARLRLLNRPLYFAGARLLNIFLNIGLNLFFLVLCPMILSGEYESVGWLRPLAEAVYDPELGVGYVFLSNLIANGLYLLILAPLLLQARLQLDRTFWKPMLVYAYPLLLMGLAGVANEMLSRAMLRQWLPEGFYPDYDNEAALGIFGACYKLSVFMNLAIQAFRFAAEPFFFSKAADKNSPQLFSNVMYYFILASCFIFFAVTVNLPWLAPILLRDPIYLEGLEVVPVLLLGYLFLGIYLNLSIWFKLADKTKYGSWFTGSGAVLTVLLNLVLIPTLGYMGAALATLLVYLYMAAVCYYFGQKHFYIPYRLGAGLTYILLSIAAAYAILYLLPDNLILSGVLGIGSVLVFALLVFLYEKRNRQQKVNQIP